MISKVESQMTALQEKINDPNFFSSENNETQPVLDELAEFEITLDGYYKRWEELE